MSDDPYFVCRGCGEGNNLSDLTEVEEEEPDHSHFECPDCGGENFAKLPEERHQQQEQREPPEPPEDREGREEPPREPTMDQERERKRQAWVRSLERDGMRR